MAELRQSPNRKKTGALMRLRDPSHTAGEEKRTACHAPEATSDSPWMAGDMPFVFLWTMGLGFLIAISWWHIDRYEEMHSKNVNENLSADV